MAKLIKGDEKEIPILARMLNLIWIYDELLCLAALIVLNLVKAGVTVNIIVIIHMVICTGLNLYASRSKKYELAALMISYLINITLLPFLFIFGGGFASGASVLLLCGYMVSFMLLDGMRLLVAVIINTLWNIITLAYGYYNPEKVVSISRKDAVLVDLLLCFFIACIIGNIALSLYKKIYKRISYSIESSQKLIEDSSSVKVSFLTNMSSELKTPINAIINMTELLEKEENAVTLEISTMKSSAFSLLTTIDNVLNYSKLNLGRLELEPHQFSFARMLQDLFYTINLELIGKDIPLLIDLNPDIPNLLYGDEEKIKQIFNYILYNAVQNIDEGRVNVYITYKDTEKKNCITIMVTVSDTGLGLTEDEQSAIFNSYEIYDSKKYSQLKKVGLELTICRDILKLMNGKIKIDSINAVGTAINFQFDVFSVDDMPMVDCDRLSNRKVLVFLPKVSRNSFWNELMSDFGIVPEIVHSVRSLDIHLRDKIYDLIFISDYSYESAKDIIDSYKCQEKCYIIADADADYGDYDKCRILRRPLSALNINEAISGSWKVEDYKSDDVGQSFVAPEAKVLVADENMINIRVMNGLLEKYNIHAYIATNGNEAFEKCNNTKFDLIFLEQGMGESSEYKTLNELRERLGADYLNVPVICMTSAIGEGVREDMGRIGYKDCLLVPVKHKHLEKILRENLDEKLISTIQDKNGEAINVAESEKFTPGLTVEQGLLRTGGDMEVYCAILNTYYREGQQKINDIIEEHNTGDLPLFVINVHAVKGSSASIGGLEVSELFRQLEFAGKDNDLDFIQGHLEPAIEKYRLLLEDVREYLIQNGQYEEEKTMSTNAPLEEFDVEQMKIFREHLDNFDTSECEDMLNEWTDHNFGPEINNYLSEMKRTCDSFDYDRTMEYADEFIEVFS